MKIATALFIALLFAGVLLAACGGSDDDGPIVLGAVYNTTGSQALLDVPSAHGSAVALEQINASGGVLDRGLSLVTAEGDGDFDALASKVEALLDDNEDIVALLGLSDTDNVLAAAPVAASHERVFLSSGATSPQLPAQVPEYLFLAAFGDNVQAAAGAEWAYDELAARNVLVLFDPNLSYPLLLQDYFIQRFEALDGTVVAAERIEPRSDDVGLPAIGEVDLIFLSVETAEDAAKVIPMLRESGYAGPILGGDGYDAGSVWAALPDISNVYFTTHVYLGADNPNPKVGEFLSAYAEAYTGEAPSAFAALGYDAVGLMAAAIESAGEATPETVLEGLTSIDSYEGVTGTISFTSGNRIPSKSVTILEVQDGAQTFVTELTPAEVPAP